MNSFITDLRPIVSPARQRNSRGVRRFNLSAAAFSCTLLSLLIFASSGVAQAQTDPLTITKDGKLSVAGNADFSGNVDVNGNVSIRRATPGVALEVGQNQAIRLGNANISSGGDLVNLSNHAWFDGTAWQSDGTAGALYQISAQTHNWYVHDGKGVFAKVMTITPNGRVGIATSNTQFAQLSVAGGATPALRLDANSGVAAMSIGGTGELLVDAVGVTGGRFIVKDGGNVGIGTNNPTQAKLVVSGGTNMVPVGNIGISYFSEQDSPGKINRYKAGDALRDKYIGPIVSIYATGNIWSGYSFVSSSDARIKNIQGRSDSAADLRTLLGIEVTDYRYKDVIGRGNGAYKKLTGQQVERVFPQAVSKHTDVVPDIYQQASIQDGWVTLTTDLKKGERVKLITQQGEDGIFEVVEVAQGRFRTAFKPTGNKIFVYGREVNDFLTVDYQAISMLTVSATQQIKKEKDEEVKALQEENAALRSQLAEQEKRLAAIEALLLSGDKPAARTASLKKD